MSEVEILEKMEKHDKNEKEGFLFFPETQSHRARLRVIRHDLDAICISDARRFSALQTDAEKARHEYIARQELIFKEAFLHRELEIASRVSKDIARAHGIPTDEVMAPKNDLISALEALRAKKALGAPQEPIEMKFTKPNEAEPIEVNTRRALNGNVGALRPT